MNPAARRIEAGKPTDGRQHERTPTMGLFDLTDLVVQRGLEGASLRQQVLSNNLANANTAGFKRSDVDFQSSLASALGSGDPTQSIAGVAFQPQTASSTTMTADEIGRASCRERV